MNDNESGQLDMFGGVEGETPVEREMKLNAPTLKPLSRVARRAIKTSVEIELEPPEEISYQHTVFCQTSLPYRNPGKEVRIWERRQGNVGLRVEAGAAQLPDKPVWVDLPLPSGPRARLILCYLNAEAIKQQSPLIEIENSLTAFTRRLGLASKGQNINAIKNQLSALSASTMRLGFTYGDRSVTIKQDIVRGFDLWFPKNERQRVLWPATVQLSDQYFNSLVNHAVPLDERALGALSHSALALDIYSWLAQRLHRIPQGEQQFIKWASIKDYHFGQGYGRMDNFKRVFRVAMKQVLVQYQVANVEEDRHGLTLRNSAPPVPKKLYVVNKLVE